MRKHEFDRDRNRCEADIQQAPVFCKAQSYARFALWLDGELAKLERRWQHMAAPAARKTLSRSVRAQRISPTITKTKPK